MSKPLFSSVVFNKEEFDKWSESGYPCEEHTDELWNEKTQSFGIFPETSTVTTQSNISPKLVTTKNNGTTYATTNNNIKNGVILYQ